MAQEDQTQKCNRSISGCDTGSFGKSSKKQKLKATPKKVPQRGLGVAQLEKIRIEEQRKKDTAVAAAANLPSPFVSSSKSFYMPLIPNFHHSNQSSSCSIPFPSGSLPDFRSPLSLQNDDLKISNTLPLANNGGFEANLHAVPVPAQGSVPQFWNSHEFNFEKESSRVDPGLSFTSRLNLPYESNLPNWVQRTQQPQQSSSSLVNPSSGTSVAPVLHYSMEPPSNQNYSGNCLPMQQEKIIDMKRSYPFSLDVPPAHSFNFKLATLTAPMKTNETASCGSGSGFIFYAGNSALSMYRETRSTSASSSEPNPKKRKTESENLNGDFLSLAPPSPTSTIRALPYSVSQSCQGNANGIPPPESSLLNQQQPFYSFFPQETAKAPIGQTAARMENCNGEVGEDLDLNLKL